MRKFGWMFVSLSRKTIRRILKVSEHLIGYNLFWYYREETVSNKRQKSKTFTNNFNIVPIFTSVIYKSEVIYNFSLVQTRKNIITLRNGFI